MSVLKCFFTSDTVGAKDHHTCVGKMAENMQPLIQTINTILYIPQ